MADVAIKKDYTENDIWVYVDLRSRKHFDHALNVLAKAREIAAAFDGKTFGILTGAEDASIPAPENACMTLEAAAEECVRHGADQVKIVIHPALAVPRADIHADILAEIIRTDSPHAVLFPLSDMGRETAARCACLCDVGLIADCEGLHVTDGQIVASCPSWSGEIIAELAFAENTRTGFLTVNPAIARALEQKGTPGFIERVDVDSYQVSSAIRPVSRTVTSEAHQKLETAEIVVAGGAGVGNAEGFAMVRQLAGTIGGELGATRPPVMKHWVDEGRLIGQTGKTIKPKLLFTIGTSGAVQYTAGITNAEFTVAINRDPKAPIFQHADIGIVADARALLPELTKEIGQIVMRNLADALCEIGDAEGARFGARLERLRESRSWTREQIAEKTGQTPEFIEQVETDMMTPSVAFLLRLAKAFDVDPGTFLKDDEKAQLQDQRAKAFIKRTKNYFYQTLTPEAENQHLRGFLITIEPNQAHKPVDYRHEGEEFVYVMEGNLELTLDTRVHRLKPGESKHFNSEIPHKLKSLGNEITRCLVMLYTP